MSTYWFQDKNTTWFSSTNVNMKIAYYMPFKPLGHKNPSGDLIIGTELFQFLQRNEAEIALISRLRCRWIYLKPYLWPLLIIEILRTLYVCLRDRPDIWLTYHSYYKAPDILGSVCCRVLKIPYVIFQGVYSTKRKRSVVTKIGFYLNRFALCSADFVFTNKKTDLKNLLRIIPQTKIMYVPPGLHPEKFQFNPKMRQEIRNMMGADDLVIVMTAAMFRPGVKTEGIIGVINSCHVLAERGRNIMLWIAGDGINSQQLSDLAAERLGDRAVFLGKINRDDMKKYYSGADIFCFPGINESLGMVYLEAQTCQLPVVAYGNWGAAEAVEDGETGFLVDAERHVDLSETLDLLVTDSELRKNMGKAAAAHVKKKHDLQKNYSLVWQALQSQISGAV